MTKLNEWMKRTWSAMLCVGWYCQTGAESALTQPTAAREASTVAGNLILKETFGKIMMIKELIASFLWEGLMHKVQGKKIDTGRVLFCWCCGGSCRALAERNSGYFFDEDFKYAGRFFKYFRPRRTRRTVQIGHSKGLRRIFTELAIP